MTRRSFVKYVAAALTPLSGCGLNPQPPVRVGASIWPGYECLFIARSLQLFEKHPIKLVEYPTTPEVIRAFKNRAIEVAALTADDLLRLSTQESDVRAILVMDLSLGADALISKPEIKCVPELRGTRIGLEVNTVGVYMLMRALRSAGLKAEDVEVVPLDADQHLAAFSSGKVDGLVTYEPHRGKLLKEGGRSLFDSSEIPGEIIDYLVVRQETLDKRGSVVRALVAAWFKARERLFNEGEEMARLVAAREATTPEDFLKSLELIDLPSLEQNRRLLQPSGSCLASLQKTHKFLLEYELHEGPAPKAEVFDGGYLP